MSTAEQPDALARRIEQLAAGSGDASGDADLVAVEARLAVLEDALDALAERLESLARDGAGTTTSLLHSLGEAVRGIDRRLADQGGAGRHAADRGRALDDARTVALENAVVDRLSSALAARDEQLRSALLDPVRVAGGRDLQELRRDVTGALADLRDDVGRTVAELRDSLTTTTEQVAAALARGLTEVAEEIDVAATTTREASERVTVLAEVTETQRAEVARLLHGVRDVVVDTSRVLREELLARSAEQLGALGRRLDDLHAAVGAGAAGVAERLGAVDARVAHAAGSVERVAVGLEEVGAATDRLGGTVEGLRAEWPTRTYEVVQGARAVAEAVVLDVRGEVGARLQDVRESLEQVLGSVEHARTGLDDGTDRLAQAGHVLVAYLEQRDRLLEAERDRVLHDVLDAFSAGQSARDRTALAGRVNDVVARRRDARDAERYREAVGEPVPPTVALPDDVLALSRPAAAAGTPDDPVPDGTAEPPEAPAADAAPDAVRPDTPAVASEGTRTSAPLPDVARGGRSGAAVVPGPGRGTRGAPTRRVRTPAAGRTPASGRPSAGRGRLETMPEVPPVDVALDAAAPDGGADLAAGSAHGARRPADGDRRPS